jgi:hypothetical protein
MSFLFSLFISPVSLFAFSDMNDSTSQENVVKSLQKRIDSLELRFEKSEIEKNEAKKSVFDWSRGLFLNVSFNISDFSLKGMTSFGYMFNKTGKNNRRVIRSPLLRFGDVSMYTTDNNKYNHHCFSIGYEGLHQATDRVGFLNGIYLNAMSDLKKDKPLLYAAGLEYAASLNFWYSEASALGIGFFARLSALNTGKSFKDDFSCEYNTGLRLTYTQGFAKHTPKSRSK